MYDPYESQIENEVEEDRKSRRWPVRGIACLLLVVMLCSVISAPLAVFLYWNRNRQEQPVPTAAPVEVAADVEVGVNRIAYITPERQLATIAPDGSDQRVLTDGDQIFQFPAWSPDNSRLAVIGSEPDSQVGVYVISDVPGSDLQTLYQSEDESPFYLYWSPDSRQVSFLANHPSGLGLHIGDVPAESSRLLATGSPFYWDWTPAGDRILIHSGLSGEDSRLALLDPNGDGNEDNISEPGFFQAPGISPNGRLWAYAQVDEEDNGQLTIFDGETGQATQTRPHLGLIAMSWNPVSNVLAYITPGFDAPVFYGPLYTLDAATGENRIITDDLVVAFFWSPDGRYIAYFTVVDTDDSAIQAGILDKTNQIKAQPFLTLDIGKTAELQGCVFLSNVICKRTLSKPGRQEDRDLFMEVWVADTLEGSIRRLRAFEPTDLFVFQFLPFFDQYSLSHRIWSPDSRALVLPTVEDGAPRISVLPIDGSGSRVVADGIIGFWSQ